MHRRVRNSSEISLICRCKLTQCKLTQTVSDYTLVQYEIMRVLDVQLTVPSSHQCCISMKAECHSECIEDLRGEETGVICL